MPFLLPAALCCQQLTFSTYRTDFGDRVPPSVTVGVSAQDNVTLAVNGHEIHAA